MKPHSGCPLNTEMKLKGSTNHRRTFSLQGHRAAGQNAPAKREVWLDWGGGAGPGAPPGPALGLHRLHPSGSEGKAQVRTKSGRQQR